MEVTGSLKQKSDIITFAFWWITLTKDKGWIGGRQGNWLGDDFTNLGKR